VWPKAINTRLNALLSIVKIAAALIPQTIQRTIAKQAIKILWLVRLVARKVFTFFILKKFIIIHAPIIHLLGPFGSPFSFGRH